MYQSDEHGMVKEVWGQGVTKILCHDIVISIKIDRVLNETMMKISKNMLFSKIGVVRDSLFLSYMHG